MDKWPGSRRPRDKLVKSQTPNSAELRHFCGFVCWVLRTGRAGNFRGVKLHKLLGFLPFFKCRLSGFTHRARRELPCELRNKKVRKLPVFFARALDFRIQEAYITRMQQELLQKRCLRKDEMDYFMIILPLKVALVIYIGYQLLH